MRLPTHPLILLQTTAAAAACAALTLWPPSSGALLLIPLGHRDIGDVARTALAAHAALLGAGPLPGSLVVVGERASIARQIRSWDIVVTAAPPALCGTAGSPS